MILTFVYILSLSNALVACSNYYCFCFLPRFIFSAINCYKKKQIKKEASWVMTFALICNIITALPNCIIMIVLPILAYKNSEPTPAFDVCNESSKILHMFGMLE